MKKIFPSNKVYVAVSNVKNGGRGVFAATAIKKGEIIEIAPVIRVPEKPEEDFPLQKTLLYHYYFRWGEKSEHLVAIGLGFASIYNHSFEPNITYQKNLTENSVTFYALEDIKKDTELRMNYNYGDPKDKTPLWMDDVKPDKDKILPKNIVDEIRAVLPELLKVKKPWAITGSTNLAIRGMKVVPNKINVVASADASKNLLKILESDIFEVTEDRDGCLDKNMLEHVYLGGVKIFLLPLKTEAAIQTENGNLHKAKKIEQYLAEL